MSKRAWLRQATWDRVWVLVALVAIWQVASWAAGRYWVASPWSTVQGFVEVATNGTLAFQASYTLQATLVGIVLGGVPGIAVPLLLQHWPKLQDMLEPYLVAGYGIPKVAIAPLFIVVFGIGIESKIAVVASAVFFIVLFSTRAGIESANRNLVNMARIAGANGRHVAWHVTLPGALPYVLSGFRVAVPYAISSAVITELISSNRGLGYLVQASATDFDTRGVFVALLAITLISLVANVCVALLERWLLAWRPPVSSDAHKISSIG
ncbi:ABC transporter permease [Hydrogenophaga sp. BPS33]|uniref:ABC transporter permease n=1 Tax=Hydrogenophaga sp. BPS33 TaxID=2651974 RepID=UPI0013202459|nr:ABC transporter permease [Hydrogenophaga sp. BPS33]QHE87337.1 ABC transporter permease [Hydrogenophaga sp. BPS33]